MLSVHQRYRQTDGQTYGRATYDSNTALCTTMKIAKNKIIQKGLLKSLKRFAKFRVSEITSNPWTGSEQSFKNVSCLHCAVLHASRNVRLRQLLVKNARRG